MLLTLKTFLEDKNIEFPETSAITHRLRVLNSVSSTKQFIMSSHDNKMYRETRYGYLKPNSTGRIFPATTSGPALTRGIRYYIFGEGYLDFDLKNCHPTILYAFVKKT